MNTEDNRKTRLQKLSGSDFEIADGQSDIRGWDVKDETGRQLGQVEELIFDYQSRKVRYIVVDLEENDFDLEDREVLVPVGIAELHEKDDDVILPGVTAEQLRMLPPYEESRFDTEHETSIRNVFGGLGGAALAGGSDADFYNHGHFNDNNLYRNRTGTTEGGPSAATPVIREELQVGREEVETGGVRARTRLVEEEVSKDIRLRDETIRVEHESVDRPARAEDIKEEEIELHEYDEVPVVHKEARVVEEISLNKEVTERDETIRDTVRNTEVDLDRQDEVRARGEGSDPERGGL